MPMKIKYKVKVKINKVLKIIRNKMVITITFLHKKMKIKIRKTIMIPNSGAN